MPWHVAENVDGCDGFAVVKDDSGEVVGCHRRRADALDHLAALYASEPSVRAVAFTPTKAMQTEAERGLAWRAEFGRGGTAVGVARARDISNGRDLSLDTVKRMSSYFARHLVDKEAEGWSPGENGYPSAGRIAWALWGGDPGRAWALAIITDNEGRTVGPNDEGIMSTTNTGDAAQVETVNSGGEVRDLDFEGFTPRQTMQYEHDEDLVEIFGKYTRDSGPDGAHYVPVSPFADEGLVCSSCAFYEGPRGCEIVEGEIDPAGICKRWIIPAVYVKGAAEVDDMGDDMTADGVRYSALELERRKVGGRDVEFRVVSVGNVEIREGGPGLPMRFRGYAAVFGSPSEPLPFTETIRAGAFRRTLATGREVRMYVNHNADMVLGSTRSGTLTLREDARGLYVEGDFPDTTYARDLSILMQRGDVHSMSFGFSVPRGGDSWSADGTSRELREVILHEVSVVTGFPAYPATAGATVRTNTETETPADVEPVDSDAVSNRTQPTVLPVPLARRIHAHYARKV